MIVIKDHNKKYITLYYITIILHYNYYIIILYYNILHYKINKYFNIDFVYYNSCNMLYFFKIVIIKE